MTIRTGITTNRKALAARISELLPGTSVIYAGVPSCAYNVGAYVTIDKQGCIEISDDNTRAILMPLILEQGWGGAAPISERTPEAIAEEMEPAAPDTQSVDETSVDATVIAPEQFSEVVNCRISTPAEMKVKQLTNLVHILYSKQYVLNRAVLDGRLTIPDALIARLKEQPPETICAFTELLHDFIALGELNGFDYDDGIVHIDFPHAETHTEHWTAYAGLVVRIIKAAKEATRVNLNAPTIESEKYYMRAWLLRLGYGGDDLKAERRLLLKNLKGPSAFPNNAAAEKHKAKYAEFRQAWREANADD